MSTIELLEEDLRFLSERSQLVGKLRFSDQRSWGASANSLCSLAYGLISIDDLEMPFDESDLKACRRLFHFLPKHRKTDIVRAGLKKQWEAIS